MNNTARTTQAMDGFDVWYFGGTPGPDDDVSGCAFTEPEAPVAIDQDDARIPSFAHRCHCGQPTSATRREAKRCLLALHC